MSRWNKRCAIMLFSTARWCWQVKPVEMKCLFFSVLDFYAVTQSASSFVFKATETDGLLARASGSDFYAVSWGRTNLLWVSNQWRWLRIYKEKDFFVCLVCFFFCLFCLVRSKSCTKVRQTFSTSELHSCNLNSWCFRDPQPPFFCLLINAKGSCCSEGPNPAEKSSNGFLHPKLKDWE